MTRFFIPMMIQMMMFLSFFLSFFLVFFFFSKKKYKISASKLLPSAAAAAQLALPNVPNAKQLLYDDDDDD